MPSCTDELSCAEARERLDDHLDGFLAEGMGRRLERHLAGCPGCAAELRLAREVLRALRALPELDCPPGVLDQVARQSSLALVGPPAAAVPRRGRHGDRRRFLAAAAALMVLTLAAVLAGGSGAPRPSSADVARGEAQARFALAYVARVSERSAWRVRRQVLARRVVAPLTEDLSQSLFESLGERRDGGGAAHAASHEARKET
jgi:anti-sigma factor RsiW